MSAPVFGVVAVLIVVGLAIVFGVLHTVIEAALARHRERLATRHLPPPFVQSRHVTVRPKEQEHSR